MGRKRFLQTTPKGATYQAAMLFNAGWITADLLSAIWALAEAGIGWENIHWRELYHHMWIHERRAFKAAFALHGGRAGYFAHLKKTDDAFHLDLSTNRTQLSCRNGKRQRSHPFLLSCPR